MRQTKDIGPTKVKIGDKVRYSPIIGGEHDGKIYTVFDVGEMGSSIVVWLEERLSCVAIEAVTKID